MKDYNIEFDLLNKWLILGYGFAHIRLLSFGDILEGICFSEVSAITALFPAENCGRKKQGTQTKRTGIIGLHVWIMSEANLYSQWTQTIGIKPLSVLPPFNLLGHSRLTRS